MADTKRHSTLSYRLFELFSSMRFAIGLLTILAIASIIGTVLRQNEPYPNYAFEFGPFWFEVFETLGLYDVYHSAWFLVILAFLVISTTLCIVRNGPGFLKEMKSFRDKASDASLAHISHSRLLEGSAAPEQLDAYLRGQGFRVRQQARDDGLLLAAKKGSYNKLGYFFAHIAMVVICIGGLLDGNLPLKLGELIGKVVPETRELPQSQIPEISRLGADNLSYRGNITIAENKSADVIFLNAGKGYLVQELPFLVTLKKFHVDYYSNGMPKLFASDIVVTDKASGKQTPATIKVNHPLIIDGVAIYQASFGDGGSPLTLKAWPLSHTGAAYPVQAVSLGSSPLTLDGQPYTLELGELRVFNIENLAAEQGERDFSQRLHDAREVKKEEKGVKNVGPSITYKLRDARGQAVEYHVYMSPIEQEGLLYQIAGVRREVSEPFRYLRLPVDDDGKIDSFMRLRAALQDKALLGQAADIAAREALGSGAIDPATRASFKESVHWALLLTISAFLISATAMIAFL